MEIFLECQPSQPNILGLASPVIRIDINNSSFPKLLLFVGQTNKNERKRLYGADPFMANKRMHGKYEAFYDRKVHLHRTLTPVPFDFYGKFCI